MKPQTTPERPANTVTTPKHKAILMGGWWSFVVAGVFFIGGVVLLWCSNNFVVEALVLWPKDMNKIYHHHHQNSFHCYINPIATATSISTTAPPS